MRALALFPTIRDVSGAPALFRAGLGVSGAFLLVREQERRRMSQTSLKNVVD